MTLNDLKSGERGKVKRISGNGPLRRRLLDLGIHPGGLITMIKAAPLRDPLEIALGNGHLSLRRHEAAMIDIEPIDKNRAKRFDRKASNKNRSGR